MSGEESVTFLMLPNDLVLNCLACVSRLYYPTLSLVCKRFRSMLASRELYQTRTLLGRTESCLYVCLTLPNYESPQRWFTLYLRPNSPKKVLVPISSPHTYQSDFVGVGSNIYAIGGFMNSDDASSSVMVMDCRSHTWREAPIRFARVTPSACVLDGKIYVTGGCQSPDATKWTEVFDTKTQTWEFKSGPDEKICSGFRYQSVAYDGTVYVKCFTKHTTFKLHKARWRAVDLAMNAGWFWSSSYCVIDNVLFCYGCKMIRWYNSEERCWNALQGLETLLRAFPPRVQVADYGGKLAVFWEQNVSGNERHPENIIWCAEITLEKRKQGKIWGTLEWSGVVSTPNEPYAVAHVRVAKL